MTGAGLPELAFYGIFENITTLLKFSASKNVSNDLWFLKFIIT